MRPQLVNNSIIKSYENQLSELRSQFIAIQESYEYPTIIKNLDALENNLKSLNERQIRTRTISRNFTLENNKRTINKSSPIKPEIQRNLIYILIGTFLFSLITFIFENMMTFL